MAIFKCKMCGGDLEITEGVSVAECKYCETKQTIPSGDNDKKINLFNRANKLRMACDFDRAASVYENIISEFPEEAEAYWGLCLCNYGIEYVDDPVTGEKKPTCHRASFEKLQEDENFNAAIDYADVTAQKLYRAEAREIDRITEEILSISKNEKPYDIFICYKELDEDKNRTVDSLMAEKIYDMLTEKGYKVFFARITLEDKIGMQYEPYIFAALNSAKIMLSIGTQYEYFHAVWVKNEWSRFLKLASKDKSKVFIPCYKDMDPYDLPSEFKALQAQDLGKVGAEQDLLRGIEKIMGKKHPDIQEQKTVVVNSATGATPQTLLTRAKLAIESGNYDAVKKFCESVLNMSPENSDAYLYKLLADLQISSLEKLSEGIEEFDKNINYQRAYRFGDAKRKEWLDFCCKSIIYNKATKAMVGAKCSKDFREAAEIFEKIQGFKDADEQKEKCKQFTELAEYEEEENRKENIYQSALKKKNSAKTCKELKEAIGKFEEIPDYKDVKNQISESASTAIGWYYDGIERKNIIIAIYQKVRILSKLNAISLLTVIIFVILTILTILTIVNPKIADIDNDLFVSRALIASLVIVVITSFACAYVEGKYDQKTDTIKKGSFFEGFLGLLVFWSIPLAAFGLKDEIKGANRDIEFYEEQINNLKPKTSSQIEEKRKDTEKSIRKIKRAHSRFNFRILLLLIIAVLITTVPSVIIPNIRVEKAMQLYEEGKYDEAYRIVSSIGTAKAMSMTQDIIHTLQMSELENLEIGDVINFGVQIGGNIKKGESIDERDWLVLDIVDGKALVIENTYIGHTITDFNGSTWEDSNVRDYLNGEFINNNFSDEQKEMIVLSDVYFDGNPDIESQEENSTKDKVFLLSVNEARRYFYSDSNRVWAYSWYLRTPGERFFFTGEYFRTGVTVEGSINSSDAPNDSVIRAAMWINISNIG